MQEMMKMAKMKALKELISKMRKMEHSEHEASEDPFEENESEELADEGMEDEVDPGVMNNDDDDFETEKKQFMKKGLGRPMNTGKTKSIMMSLSMGKPKSKKS